MNTTAMAQRWLQPTGILSLMEDLGTAVNENPDCLFMGGGNPADISELNTLFRQQLMHIASNADLSRMMLGSYQSPQGDLVFRQSLANYLSDTWRCEINESNIAVVGGSQSAFYILFNMFAGRQQDGRVKTIHLPLSPEYIGYQDVGIAGNIFSATPPLVTITAKHTFTYSVNFEQLTIDPSVGAIALSRPTNPTGNVISDDDLIKLSKLAQLHDIPLIIDGAYGSPFPDILFTNTRPIWNSHTIHVLSLSKLGLPGVRCGIVVAGKDVISCLKNANTVISLGSSNVGPFIAERLLADNKMPAITQGIIKPFYRAKAEFAIAQLSSALSGLPYYLHQCDGAMFIWLWLKDLPISSQQLYQRLKHRGVLVVPGEQFFVGLDPAWKHTRECVRISFAQSESIIAAGAKIIAEEVHRAHAEHQHRLTPST